jgi:hypothetical protein
VSILSAAKAFAGAAVTGFGVYVGVRADGVTLEEWYLVVTATATALGVVYGVPNKAKDETVTVDGEPFVPDLVASADAEVETDPVA